MKIIRLKKMRKNCKKNLLVYQATNRNKNNNKYYNYCSNDDNQR